MLKNLLKLLPLLLLLSTIGWAQTTINFDTDGNWTQDGSVASLASYGAHIYSESGFSIVGTNVLRNTSSTQDGFAGALGTYSLRIRNVSGAKALINISTGGVANFSFKVRRWDNTPMPNYTVKYSVDNGSNWTNLADIDGTLLTTSDWFTYSGTINNANANIEIEIANTGITERIMIDDFTWTGYGGGSSNTTVAFTSSSATVSEGVGTYNLALGISNEDATNATQCEVALTTGSATDINNYTTQTVTFPAASSANQQVSITVTDDAVYEGNETLTFTIQNISGGNSAAAGSPTTFDLTISENDWPLATVPYSEDFSNCSTQLWQVQSVASNKNWNCGSGYQAINGYGGDVASIDYLISPAFNLNNYSNERISFDSYTQYADASYPPVEIIYSSDYDGTNLGTANWIALVPVWAPENSTIWTGSGYIDVSGIAGTAVCFAFHYSSTGTGSGTSSLWQIDNFVLEEGPAAPTISTSTAALTALDYEVGNGPAVSQSFNVSATNLTNNITITPPANFEISTDNINFQSTVINLAQVGGTVASTAIYVRLKSGLVINNYNDNIVISSTGAADKNVNCDGNVTPVIVIPTAWINEIHYDNDGVDVNELIEIVIKNAGSYNLSDFTVSLYNGSDGTIYDSRKVSTFTAGDVHGAYSFFYLIYPSNSIQNGSDGIAIDWNGHLVQFISYEGSFDGVGGSANGITSQMINTWETSSKLVGSSIQLVGTGEAYHNFMWVDPVASPGIINVGQVMGVPPPVPFDYRYLLLLFIALAATILYRFFKH